MGNLNSGPHSLRYMQVQHSINSQPNMNCLLLIIIFSKIYFDYYKTTNLTLECFKDLTDLPAKNQCYPDKLPGSEIR